MFIRGNRVKIKPFVCYSNPVLNPNAVYIIDMILYNCVGEYMVYCLRGVDLVFHEEDLIFLGKPKLELE